LRYFSSAGYIVNKTQSSSLDLNTVNMLVVPLSLKFQFSTHNNNFELTGDPLKLINALQRMFSFFN